MGEKESLKWDKSEAGYVNSKCGRYKIVPVFNSCVRPQRFSASLENGFTIGKFCDTQRDAKIVCDRHFKKFYNAQKT